MKSYYELWMILWNWKKEFSVKEFIAIFPSPDPNKILHDLTKKGFLERAGWGKYKVNSPKQLFKNRTDIKKTYEFLKQVKLKYAFTDVDSVFLWTKGGYQIGRFFGFYPIYIKVLRSDLKKWKKILKSNKIRFYVKGTPLKETFFGTFCVLQSEQDFKTEKVDGLFVDSLKNTVEFCKKNIYQYEPALEMLNEMYNLKMKIRYREV